ncbi:excisionase family DNA binding protein [Natronobacillus azotifigens]|uniref:Excisionase family DNA-binding protein n=1 Tax=Natronobacillus azotifigens TaxID=472978 RepID=A0A9J6R8V5_9BACI|nr:excisionase family DNA-binding protein [Natronobacillus azotifigens]MCZ0701684.1 excisionase family DNA-binding protein [Natronobacillus azotifigens]
MYISIKETADYLEISEPEVRQLIFQQKIRALYDGENYLLNKDQFQTHQKQMEKYRQMMQEYLQEPIPEDIDIKDED